MTALTTAARETNTVTESHGILNLHSRLGKIMEIRKICLGHGISDFSKTCV